MQPTKVSEAVNQALETNAYSDKYRQPQSRNFLGEFMGFQIEPNRNIICQYGYPENPTFNDFYALYVRVAPAKAIIDKPVDMTWQDWPVVRDATEFDDNGEAVPAKAGAAKSPFEFDM